MAKSLLILFVTQWSKSIAQCTSPASNDCSWCHGTVTCGANCHCIINCVGNRACSGATLNCVPGAFWCNINCDGSNACEGTTINGVGAQELNVNGTGDYSLYNTNVLCPTDGPCVVRCSGYSACGANVEGADSSSVEVFAGPEAGVMIGANITCPTDTGSCNVYTSAPTVKPTTNPTQTTFNPTLHPTFLPTLSPTSIPTSSPITLNPTFLPTLSPTFVPTQYPFVTPTFRPTEAPSRRPTSEGMVAEETANMEEDGKDQSVSQNVAVLDTISVVMIIICGILAVAVIVALTAFIMYRKGICFRRSAPDLNIMKQIHPEPDKADENNNNNVNAVAVADNKVENKLQFTIEGRKDNALPHLAVNAIEREQESDSEDLFDSNSEELFDTNHNTKTTMTPETSQGHKKNIETSTGNSQKNKIENVRGAFTVEGNMERQQKEQRTVEGGFEA